MQFNCFGFQHSRLVAGLLTFFSAGAGCVCDVRVCRANV